MKKKLNSNILPEQDIIPVVLSNLAAKHFTGNNEKIMESFISQLPLADLEQFFESFMPKLANQVDLNNLDLTEIEQINYVTLANSVADKVNLDGLAAFNEDQLNSFEGSLKTFFRSLLHDVAFPLMVFENPNIAVSAKNVLMRVVSSLSKQEADASVFFKEMDLENLPEKPSIELVQKLGGRFDGLVNNTTTISEEADNVLESTENEEGSGIVHCELTTDQTIYLAYILQTEHFLIKKWKPFANLLKSNGKKYETIIVDADFKRLGLLLTVIDQLHEKKTSLGYRFLRMDRGSGIWPFFQGFLLASNNELFTRELRKYLSDYRDDTQAEKIINEVLDQTNQSKITATVKEITKKQNAKS